MTRLMTRLRRPRLQKPKHATYRLTAVAVAVALSGAAQGATTSNKAGTATGSFKTNNDYTATKTGGAELSSLSYHGALAGTAVDTGTTAFHSNGSFVGHGTEVCDPCTIAGKTGGFTAMYTYSGTGVTYTGRLVFTRGFGNLAGLTGSGTFKGNVTTNTNSYSYAYHLS